MTRSTLLAHCRRAGSLALALWAGAASATIDSDLRCLALNIYHEARGESVDGKFAVAAVTLNRVASSRFPDSVCDVVWQRGQFSWTDDGRPDRPYETEAWQESMWIARATYEFSHPSNVGAATHYHAVYVRPRWASADRAVARVGRHIFYE